MAMNFMGPQKHKVLPWTVMEDPVPPWQRGAEGLSLKTQKSIGKRRVTWPQRTIPILGAVKWTHISVDSHATQGAISTVQTVSFDQSKISSTSHSVFGTQTLIAMCHKNPLMRPIQSQLKPIHTFTSRLSKISLNIILPSTCWGFLTNMLCTFNIYHPCYLYRPSFLV
jgi:hypothetical protein